MKGDSWLHVRIALPLWQPAGLDLDPTVLPACPVRLVLPETGSVLVEVGRTPGLPAGAETWAELSPQGGPGGEPTILRGEVQEGRVRFPFVGIHLVLKIQVVTSLSWGAPLARVLEQAGPGPVRPGEEVVFRFGVIPAFPALSGRAVDEKGTPLADAVLEYCFFMYLQPAYSPDASRFPKHRLRTGPDGRFRLPISDMFWPAGIEKLLPRPFGATGRVTDAPLIHRGCWIGTTRGAPAARQARISLPPAFPAGGHEVGDVVFALLPPLLVAGRVVDREALPVPDAIVWLERQESTDPARPERSSWRSVSGDISDGEGRFTIRGTAEGGLRIVARKKGYLESRQPVAAGSRDLLLALVGEAAVKGSFLLPEGVNPDSFQVFLKARGRPGDPGRQGGVFPSGEFEVLGAEAGTADLEIGFRASKTPLIRVEGIALEAGKVNKDPRLQRLDLRPYLLVEDLEVVNGRGVPVSFCMVLVCGSGEPTPWSNVFSGRALVTVPAGTEELVLHTEGYRDTKVTLRGGRQRIVLEENLTVILRPDSATQALADGAKLGFLLRSEETGLNSTGLEAGEGGERFRVGPGAYQVSFRYAREGLSTRAIPIPGPLRIEVREVGEEQLFLVAIPPETMRHAEALLKTLAERRRAAGRR